MEDTDYGEEFGCPNSSVTIKEPIARIYGRGFECMMKKVRIIIGRNSSKGSVDVDMGLSSFVSRNHLEIYFELNKFFLLCHGKNGIFVENTFKAHGSPPLELPHQCNMRFPSTNTRIFFESLLPHSRTFADVPSHLSSTLLSPSLSQSVNNDSRIGNHCFKRRGVSLSLAQESDYHSRDMVNDVGNSYRLYPTLKQRINSDLNSSSLSPNDTLSAANSCPESPRQTALHHSLHSAGFRPNGISQYAMGSSSIPSEKTLTQVHNASLFNSTPATQTTRILDHSTSSAASSSFYRDSMGEDGSSDSDVQLDRGDDFTKPPYSYAQMIVQAVNSTPDRQLTLNGIYNYIAHNFKYYKPHDKGWQNSIRHNLSLNRYFIKVARQQDEPGKGSFWRIDPMYEEKLIATAYRKRRQRGIHVFTGGGGGSAPVHSSSAPKNDVQFQRRIRLTSINSGATAINHLAADGNSDTLLLSSANLQQQMLAATSANGNSLVDGMDLSMLGSAPIGNFGAISDNSDGSTYCGNSTLDSDCRLPPDSNSVLFRPSSTASSQVTLPHRSDAMLLNSALLGSPINNHSNSYLHIASRSNRLLVTSPNRLRTAAGHSLLLRRTGAELSSCDSQFIDVESDNGKLSIKPEMDDVESDAKSDTHQDLMLGAAMSSLTPNFDA